MEQNVIRRGREWPHDNQMAEMPVQVLRIGGVGRPPCLPIFVRMGFEIRNGPAPRVCGWVANDRVSSYVPDLTTRTVAPTGKNPFSRWLDSGAGAPYGGCLHTTALSIVHRYALNRFR